MAYLNNNQNQNQQNNELGMNNPQQTPASGQPQQEQPQQMQSAAPSAPAPQTAPQAQQPAAPQVKAPSSGMSSFHQYQKANQGAAQNRLGQAVQSNLQKNANQAQGALQRGQTNFQQLMEQGTLADRQNAVADVTKTTTQARNIYTGDLAADKAAQQNTLQTAQARATEIDQQKAAETQAITQERATLEQQRKDEYTRRVQEASANLANQNKLAQEYGSGVGEGGMPIGPKNLGDVIQAQKAYDAAKKNTALTDFGTDKTAALAQREQQLAFADFQKAQATDQATAAQKMLDELNTRQFTTGVDADMQKRFADIINARYSGPQSLRETGAYDETLSRVNKAQDLATMAKTAGGREDLLAQLYGRPGTEYTRGMSRLDAALLNTNKDAMQGIQTEAQKLGGTRDALARANVDTQLSAQNRSKEIADIRGQARTEFSKQQEAEEALTEGRLDEAIASGNEFAQYFKDQLTGKTGTTQLNPYEAALLGVSSGEGLYNLGGDAVKTAQLERGKMISKDEFARQQALSNLAKMDQSNELKQELKYADESLAGTQTAADALDTEGTRAALNDAETAFREQAEAANIKGYGKGKASKGNWMGKKTKTASTTIRNNVADMLTAAGYDMNSEVGQQVAKSILSDEQATARFLTGANNQTEVSKDGTLMGAVQGAGAGASLGSAAGPVGTAIGAGAGALAGSYLGGGTVDPLQQQIDVLNSIGLGAVGEGMQDVRNNAAKAANANYDIANLMSGGTLNKIPGLGSLMGNISSTIGGIDGGALAKAAKAKANAAAKKDLLKNYKNYLSGAGFSNRLGVSATDKAAVDRLGGLQQLLSRLDKTNVKG